jgi:hypothetical protein
MHAVPFLDLLQLAFTTKPSKEKRMNKEKARELLGQLIAIREQIERMAENGFSWDRMAEIKENLNIAIIDLENALD